MAASSPIPLSFASFRFSSKALKPARAGGYVRTAIPKRQDLRINDGVAFTTEGFACSPSGNEGRVELIGAFLMRTNGKRLIKPGSTNNSRQSRCVHLKVLGSSEYRRWSVR